jgi:hypothetical protein
MMSDHGPLFSASDRRRPVALVASTGFLLLGAASLLASLHLTAAPSSADVPRGLPFAATPYVLGDDLQAYVAFLRSGGPPPDGIPAIDAPVFIPVSRARLDPDDMVIGFAHGGQARAYPQRILVHHEIVNDQVGGLNVAVTYCPLTATAQGFKRGNTTLGVSGQLLNSNLVLFDRETRSYFSQINATGLTGEHRGRTLDEVNVIWTTWGRWREAHPGTEVLSEETGHLRNYARDPYGGYNPVRGYYGQDGTVFPVMHRSDRHPTKEMVVGARTAERSAYFVLAELARDRVQQTPSFLAVYDPALDTAHIFDVAGAEVRVTPEEDGMYLFQGTVYPAAALPLPEVIPVEAFHFAWHAFYPNSETP